MKDMNNKKLYYMDYKNADGEQKELEIRADSIEEARKIADQEGEKLLKEGAQIQDLYLVVDKAEKSKDKKNKYAISGVVMGLAVWGILEFYPFGQHIGNIQKEEERISADKKTFDSKDMVKAIESGKTCYKGSHKSWSCIYELGEDLKFKISYTGFAHKVSIKKAGHAYGDYYLPMDTLSTTGTNQRIGYLLTSVCIPIRAGMRIISKYNDGKHDIFKMFASTAYVSPADGRVFPDKELCEDMTRISFGWGRQ